MTGPGARRRETAPAYSGWFTPAQLMGLAAARGRLGREDSIGRYLLHSWLAQTS